MNLNQRIEHWLVSTQDEFHIRLGASSSERPQVTLCYAQSWDGSITTQPGVTLALSSDAGMRLTHQMRSLHDGILVGINTVLADDPRLNVREWSGDDPQPIVMDSQLRMPATSQLCRNGKQRCWVLTTPEAASERSDCELIVVPSDQAGHVDLQAALEALYARGIRSVMVEGGAEVIGAFLESRLADAIVLTVAPVLVGGYNAIAELRGPDMASFPYISPLCSEQLADEVIVWGNLNYRHDVEYEANA